MRITKKRAAIAGISALAMACTGAFITISGADASAVAGGKCSPRGGVTGRPTLICAPVPSSPTAYRWRPIVAAPGTAGAKGPAGPAGAVGPAGPAGTPGPAGADGKDGAVGPAGAAGPAGADGKDGPAGKNGVTDLQADGPYPGSTQVQGGNSTTQWAAGTTVQTAWVRCPTGKKALGGGFSAETGGANVQVVSSYPFALDKDGKFDPAADLGKPDNSILPNAWVVEGYYHAAVGSAQVRPWVVCAKVS